MNNGDKFIVSRNGTVGSVIVKIEQQPTTSNYVRQNRLAYVITSEETATVYGDRGDIDYTNAMLIETTPPTTSGTVEIESSVTINGKNYTVTTIGKGAFNSMMGSATELTDIIIPNGVTLIENGAFMNCTSLNNIEIPNSVTTIENSAFHGCTSLTNITIPNSITSIGGSVFYNTPWLETQKANATNGLVIVNNSLIDGTSATGKIIIPNGVTKLSGMAFSGCTSIREVTITTYVIEVGLATFGGWTNAQKINVWWNEGEKPLRLE